MFLTDFIVPIMYKNTISSTEAWKQFLPLVNEHLWYFILYGLFKTVLWTIAVFVIVMGGIFTCCIGFILLVIPYIGSVVMLPVAYTFRAFSVDFLQQFGPDFTIFPSPGNESSKDIVQE
jgi:hypothetical protein